MFYDGVGGDEAGSKDEASELPSIRARNPTAAPAPVTGPTWTVWCAKRRPNRH